MQDAKVIHRSGAAAPAQFNVNILHVIIGEQAEQMKLMAMQISAHQNEIAELTARAEGARNELERPALPPDPPQPQS